MSHSRWDTLKSSQDSTDKATMMAFHQGYILALEDALDDLDQEGPEASDYPHHAIRFLLGKSLSEAQESMQAVLKVERE